MTCRPDCVHGGLHDVVDWIMLLGRAAHQYKCVQDVAQFSLKQCKAPVSKGCSRGVHKLGTYTTRRRCFWQAFSTSGVMRTLHMLMSRPACPGGHFLRATPPNKSNVRTNVGDVAQAGFARHKWTLEGSSDCKRDLFLACIVFQMRCEPSPSVLHSSLTD